MIRTGLPLLGIALLVSTIAPTTQVGAAGTPFELEPDQHASHTDARSRPPGINKRPFEYCPTEPGL